MTETRPLSSEQANALRMAARILAPHKTPEQRRQAAINVDGHIKKGTWPAFTGQEVSALAYPDDSAMQARFYESIQAAVTAGKLPPIWHEPEPAFSVTGLAMWQGAAIAPNSPLRAMLDDAWPVVAAPADAVKPASGQRLDSEGPPIPGTIAPVASGRLAIKAAWQIECDKGRPATDEEVMAMLRAWGKSGAEPNHLMDCDKLPPGTSSAVVSAVRGGAIPWQTSKGKVNAFSLEACQKALEKWRKSRQ